MPCQPATILEPPEADSHIALVDVRAADADAAVKAAWAAYRPNAPWPLKVVTPPAMLPEIRVGATLMVDPGRFVGGQLVAENVTVTAVTP